METDIKQLYMLKPGDTFTYRSSEYVLVKHDQTRSTIATVGDGEIKIYKLAMRAPVTVTGHDDAALGLAFRAMQPEIPVKPGDKVRIKVTDATRRRGIAGTETIVEKVNSKTVSLSNGWRVSPALIEAA